MKKLLFLAIMALFLAFNTQADAAVDIFNQPVSVDESFSAVVVTFEFTFADSSDKYHTVPIFIADCNDVDAYVSAVQSAAGDANVVYHFSGVDDVQSETAIWFTSTPGDLDALSNTAKHDTIGCEAGANVIQFHSARWLVIEILGGGTSNADGNVVTFFVNFTKDHYFINNAQPVKVARKATHSYTAP